MGAWTRFAGGVCGVLAVLVLAGAARAGEERYPQLGIVIEPPPRYMPVPVQPDEKWVVLRYVGEPDFKEGARTEPRLYVARIEYAEDPAPLPDPPPITTFERYLEQEWDLWKADGSRPGKARGREATEHDLEPAPTKEATELRRVGRSGWAHVQIAGNYTWIVFGFCDGVELDEQVRAWRKMAEKLELSDPVPHPQAEKWARHYAKNPQFRAPELRIRLRERLVGKWEAQDTENYLLLFDTKKEQLINHLAKRLEGIRREYEARFASAQEITAVSAVRICKDEEQYRRYGGSPGTAGYWNSETEELVLFVFENESGDSQSGKENSRLVMYHEAFHQYIHYAAGELAPHSWFGEGYGDYFGGAQFNVNGKVGHIDPNPWRFGFIKQAIESRLTASWGEIGWMEQPEFYGANRPVHYAMGWSMVYFLEESPQVRKNPLWKKILPTYFETLKAANAREKAALTAAEEAGDAEAHGKLLEKIRAEASAAAFDDVDLREIEDAWRVFTLELKPR